MQLGVCLVVSVLFIARIIIASGSCYNPEKDFYPYLGTRTAYELVHGNGNLRPQSVSKCKALKMWVVQRHGTKYMENVYKPMMFNLVNLRDQILENHQNGYGQLCTQDLVELRDWKLDSSIYEQADAALSPQGKKELTEFAERLKNTFPELINSESNEVNDFLVRNSMLFRSTNSQRTRQSMLSFVGGISDSNNSPLDKVVLPDSNRLLIPHLNCPAWMKEFNEKELITERKKFIKGPEMTNLLSNLTWKLGFNYTLHYDTVYTAFQMCRYEVAWYPSKVSPWCIIFSEEDLRIFEYSEDLQYYYTQGPGREMTSKLGCPILADMFSHFQTLESENSSDQPKGIFNFGHSATIRLLTTALDIGKEEEPITAMNYASSRNRIFRTSKLGPFAANVLAVFYRCEGVKPLYKVSLHTSEMPAPLTDCENGICEWEFLKKKYGSSIEKCNLDFCDSI